MSVAETVAVPHPNNGNANKAMPFIHDSLYEFALAFSSEPEALNVHTFVLKGEIMVIIHCHPSDSGRMMGKGNSRIALMREMASAIADRFNVRIKRVGISTKPCRVFARIERVLDTVVIDVPSGRRRVIRTN